MCKSEGFWDGGIVCNNVWVCWAAVIGLAALLGVMYWRMYWSLGLRQWFIGYLIRRGLYV